MICISEQNPELIHEILEQLRKKLKKTLKCQKQIRKGNLPEAFLGFHNCNRMDCQKKESSASPKERFSWFGSTLDPKGQCQTKNLKKLMVKQTFLNLMWKWENQKSKTYNLNKGLIRGLAFHKCKLWIFLVFKFLVDTSVSLFCWRSRVLGWFCCINGEFRMSANDMMWLFLAVRCFRKR